jgi:hypothetical protein
VISTPLQPALARASALLERGRGTAAADLLAPLLQSRSLKRLDELVIRGALAEAWLLKGDPQRAATVLGRTPDQIRAASQVVQRLKARGASWTEMTELVQRANEADREWFVSQLNIAMRGVEGTSIAASDSDKSLVTVKAPANAKLAVELLGRYLLSPEVQSQRTQVTLQALVEQTRLQTRLQILEQELASARQSHLGREAELRAENQRLRDQMETLRAPGR